MSLFIYLISFLEWFTTLSIEIIAIRNFTPIIWTNSISTSIILGIILLALSYWYYIWWKNSKWKSVEQLKSKIILNLAIAWAYYLFFTFVIDFFVIQFLLENTKNYFLSILISSLFLFFVPVFYASQTIPLLSEILEWDNAGEKVWKLLFFSTIGSFFGSVWTSTILFATIWVEKSATLNSIILATIAILLWIWWIKKINFPIILAIIVFSCGIFKIFQWNNSNPNILYETANSYHNIMIYETGNTRIFSQNMWYSSGIDIMTKESFFSYIIEIKEKLLQWKYEDIWIIWAAGFTLPQELAKYEHIKNLDVVDVDWDLKEISEKYFLQEKIDEKVNFIVEPCRYFINNTIKNWKKYDAIVIDIYVWNSLAPQTLTYEFFEWLTNIANDIYINLITDKNLESDFSKKVFNTMEQAFSEVYYKNTNTWNASRDTNFVATNKNLAWYTKYADENNLWIYTDDKNSIELDLFRILD